MSTVIITGGTGFIGTALSKLLISKGYHVIILTRQSKPGTENLSYATWNPGKQEIDAAAIQKADYIINLAGAGVGDKRWTKKRKEEIIESRVKSGELIVKGLKEIPNQVKAVVSVSGIGWYGPDAGVPSPVPFEETAPVATDFLGETCRAWEESIDPVTSLGKRLVKLRTGIVLSRQGGAADEFRKPIRFGFATILGSGKQIMSWIHIEDTCRLFLAAIENSTMNGVYNAVSPHPVTNRNFMILLAKKMKGGFYIPFQVPSFLLKIALGEMSIEVLKSATVSSRKTSDTGFQFLYPSIEAAIEDIAKK